MSSAQPVAIDAWHASIAVYSSSLYVSYTMRLREMISIQKSVFQKPMLCKFF